MIECTDQLGREPIRVREIHPAGALEMAAKHSMAAIVDLQLG